MILMITGSLMPVIDERFLKMCSEVIGMYTHSPRPARIYTSDDPGVCAIVASAARYLQIEHRVYRVESGDVDLYHEGGLKVSLGRDSWAKRYEQALAFRKSKGPMPLARLVRDSAMRNDFADERGEKLCVCIDDRRDVDHEAERFAAKARCLKIPTLVFRYEV
jgi:hypothetical protein